MSSSTPTEHSLTSDETMKISAVVHQGYFMPDVFRAVDSIVVGRLAPLRDLLAEWEAAAEQPMPKRAPQESAQDQGIRMGAWHIAARAVSDLREALGMPPKATHEEPDGGHTLTADCECGPDVVQVRPACVPPDIYAAAANTGFDTAVEQVVAELAEYGEEPYEDERNADREAYLRDAVTHLREVFGVTTPEAQTERPERPEVWLCPGCLRPEGHAHHERCSRAGGRR